MNLWQRLFGQIPAKASPSPSQTHSQLSSAHSQQSDGSAASQAKPRREMLRVVLRDTLNRHGIPVSWITAETLVATSRGREPGIHWRLLVKHWDPRLLTHGVAFQNSLIKRIMTFDPLAANWLLGISWQFALEDESACPPMPHPGIWTADPHPPRESPVAVAPTGGSGDVIAGPIRIADSADPGQASARQDLERLLAVRDADLKQHSQSYDATRPMDLRAEPTKF
jgi:hypothetical protein